MPRDRQTFMFSATFPNEIQRLALDFMNNYIFLTVGRVGSASKDVTQKIVFVAQQDKESYLLKFLSESEGLAKGELLLVFTETKRGADDLEWSLNNRGYRVSSIHGDKTQREREDALRQFKQGRTPILVATDVAARGLDIPNVTQVINFDLPTNCDDYVHRIGRTGRVGNVGNALSLMNEKNRNIAKDLYELLNENEQECPPWLEEMAYWGTGGGRGGGRPSRGRGGGSNRPKFGASDIRKQENNYGGNSGGGRPGGRGGYGGGGYGGSRGGYSGGYNTNDNSAW